MNTLIHLVFCVSLVSAVCSCAPTRTDDVDESSPKDTTPVSGSISIKDLVSTLPPYSYHEISLEDAKKWLNDVKIERIKLDGKDCDSVLYPADGCVGITRFYLDRMSGKFWKRYYAWEPGTCDTLTEYNVIKRSLILVGERDVSPRIREQNKPVVSTADKAASSLRSGRPSLAVPHF